MRPSLAAPLLAVLAASLAAPAARASDHGYEVTFVVGASVLDTGGARTLALDDILPLQRFLPPGVRLRDLVPTSVASRSELSGSVLLGFQASRRVGRRGWIETSFLIAPHHTLREDASFDCRADVCALAGVAALRDLLAAEDRVVAYHYGLGFAYELTRGEVRPYLSVGLGAVTFDVSGRAETDFAFDVGAGVRLNLGDRLGVRLEAVDRIIPDHFLGDGTEHDLQVRAGLSFRVP